MQVLRSIVEQSFAPPAGLAVEFHWFAGEEGGLLGSQDIAAAYEKQGKQVRGMLHMDSKTHSNLGRLYTPLIHSRLSVTAFVKNGTEPVIAFFDTDVDKNLTSFCTRLVEEYVPLKWNMTNCGKSCGSDHMSFNKAGYPVAFVTEGLDKGKLHFHTI
jgi:leucyl aminopeptidase